MKTTTFIIFFFCSFFAAFAQEKNTIEDLGIRVSDMDSLNENAPKTSTAAKKTVLKDNLIFCGGVEQDKPVGISSVFYNNRGQNYVYVFVESETPFDVRELIIDLFVIEDEARKKISTMRFNVKPKWTYTFFKHYIDAPGLYEISVSDSNNKKIGDGQVRILSK